MICWLFDKSDEVYPPVNTKVASPLDNYDEKKFYSVSQKKSPEVIWIFFIFSQTVKNFYSIFNTPITYSYVR